MSFCVLVNLESASVCSSDPPTTPEYQPSITDQTIRRRPIRGYKISSDDDSHSDGDQYFTESKPMFDDDESLTCNNDSFMDPDDSETINLPIVPYKQTSIQSWIAFSLLPRYTEKVEVPPSLSRLERILASFTMYSHLKEANMDSHFEQVFARLQMEWTYIGGLVCQIRFINTFPDHGPLFIYSS